MNVGFDRLIPYFYEIIMASKDIFSSVIDMDKAYKLSHIDCSNKSSSHHLHIIL
jgi:hypothetical protein